MAIFGCVSTVAEEIQIKKVVDKEHVDNLCARKTKKTAPMGRRRTTNWRNKMAGR